jgi:XTP/dITP diphosphohydrolase
MVLATRSPGKLKELHPMFAAAGVDVVDLDAAGVPASPEEAAVEAFDTFEENALAKARYFHRRTGLPAIADDSGLVVDALGGAPGVRSKRWSGRNDLSGQALDDANNARLVAAMRDVADRSARYVCVAAYCDGARELMARGETEGLIVLDPSGGAGFGYDPHFHSPELGCTFGESSRESKEAVSHRGRAFRSLMAQLSGQR